jgi:hypothetical protein
MDDVIAHLGGDLALQLLDPVGLRNSMIVPVSRSTMWS